jgi:hypothetical protein
MQLLVVGRSRLARGGPIRQLETLFLFDGFRWPHWMV